ncbi:annexin D3-like [Durio zibethinus]|uniref:Annexin n=1 Tax=Durio zibethinus TaxID=66656 RepID=A0A6P6AHX1_DURZI|nr:annexin D3-like [Durio zibethinus]
MKSFKKLFTSKSKTHIRESSFKIEGMGSLKVLDVIPPPEEDSEKLKKAFQGLGTDEEGIIEILGHRNASQRKKIRETYQQLYNESLIDALNSELSGDFRKAVILWTYDPPERDAKLANEALKSKKKGVKQLEIIVEMSCALSPQHLVAVRQAYCSLFDCSLEEDIIASVSAPLKKILLGLVTSYRYDKEVMDMDVANLEADRLHEAIKTKELVHDDVVYILSTRNFNQLRTTFECYKKKYGNPIDKDIMKSGKVDLEALLKMVILCIDSPEKHFAEVVGTSIIGLGTDEDSLTRAIVTRAEIDMMKVRGEYFNIYKSNLDDAVIGDTSGDYRNFLVTLLGGKI